MRGGLRTQLRRRERGRFGLWEQTDRAMTAAEG